MRKFNKPYPKVYIKHVRGEIHNLADEYDEYSFYIGKYLGELVLIRNVEDEKANYLIELDNPNYGWDKSWQSYALRDDKTYWWVEAENITIESNNNLMETDWWVEKFSIQYVNPMIMETE